MAAKKSVSTNNIISCRTLLKNLQKSYHQSLPLGTLRRLKKMEKILNSDSETLSTVQVLILIKLLAEVLSAPSA